MEVAFSPDKGDEHSGIKTIDSARTDLRVMAHEVTSVPVVEALVRARHRSVTDNIVADNKASHLAKGQAALGAMANAGPHDQRSLAARVG